MLAPAKPELVRYLSENPGAVIEEAAKLHAVTLRGVVEALPAEMRRFAPADSFIAAMHDVATWGDVTLGRFRAARSVAAISTSWARRASAAICGTSAAAGSLSWSGRSWASSPR